MKVLLLPLFTFPTGHSKVSNTMAKWIERQYPEANIVEKDILSYSQPLIEKFVASFYLGWIQVSPRSYGYIYRQWMGKQKGKRKHSLVGSWIRTYFEKKLSTLIEIEQPDMIICTHSFASSIVANVKRARGLEIPIVNVYTDLFINGVWEVKGVDYHFVPTAECKAEIMAMYKIDEAHIFVTGIPIHPDFTEKPLRPANKRAHVLIAGGNTGFMDVNHLHYLMNRYPSLEFTILCGKNEKLYHQLQSIKSSSIHVKAYIETAKEMNSLYDTVDAIISKPGGVTISEVIYKEIPLYISHYLPGPEEMNVTYLCSRKMATTVTLDDLSHNEKSAFCHPQALEAMIGQMRAYRQTCSATIPQAMQSIMKREQMKRYKRISLSSSYKKHVIKQLTS